MVERLEGFCSENDWKRAYNEMNEFEKELKDWGAVIIKFWVQIDKDTQLERFQERQNNPEKQWKITDEDWRNREKWDAYEVAVNEMLQKTNTSFAPWHVLESVDKKYARIKALRIVISEIEKALKENSEIPIYHKNENSEKEENLGGNVYRHLMNGVTHMLPFVVGGGILIAIAFLLDDYSINPSNFGMNTPIAAFFKTIGGIAFDFMLIILSGYIAMSIGDRPGLAVGIVGGAIAKAGTTFSSLMNSEEVLISSGFLGALIAGFLGGFIIKFLKRLFKFIPKSLEGIRTILIYPVAGILLIGIIMLLINPFVASINTGLNNFLFSMSGVNKVILGAILAGMMSVDLGGPVNKAAYTFGTGMLAEGHYEIMAAVMIGGMVAPLAIAILATFFPKKLPKKERQAGLLNYVMGLSFISEGAIPFASADPIRVLPACVIGSAVSGALSMAFNCSLMAPHGGIFVLPLIGNPGWYTLALVVGSVIAAGIMAIFKKNVWKNTV